MGEGILPGAGASVSNLPNAPTDNGLYFLKVAGGVASWQLTNTSNPTFTTMSLVDDGTHGAIVLSRDGGDPNALATNVAIRPGGYVLTNYFIAEAAFRLIDDGGTQHNVAMLNDTGLPTGIVFNEDPIAGDWTSYMHGTIQAMKGYITLNTTNANPVRLTTAPSSPSSATSMIVVAAGDGVASADMNVLGDGNFFGAVHSLKGFSPGTIQTIVSAAGPIAVAPTITGTLAATGSFGPVSVPGIFDITALATGTPTGFAVVGANDVINFQVFANANGGGDVLIGSINVSVTNPADGSGGDVRGSTEMLDQTTFAVAAGDSVVFTVKAHNTSATNTINFADIRLAARFFPNPA